MCASAARRAYSRGASVSKCWPSEFVSEAACRGCCSRADMDERRPHTTEVKSRQDGESDMCSGSGLGKWYRSRPKPGRLQVSTIFAPLARGCETTDSEILRLSLETRQRG